LFIFQLAAITLFIDRYCNDIGLFTSRSADGQEANEDENRVYDP